MDRILTFLAKFIVALIVMTVTLIVMTIICTVAWDSFVNDKIYHCTDGGALDFLNPGDWVHSHDGIPIMAVHQIVVDHPMNDVNTMNEPDTIKEGWSVNSLWRLWYTFVLVSIAVSVLSATMSWTTWRPKEPRPD
jgi:hypothetical protein